MLRFSRRFVPALALVSVLWMLFCVYFLSDGSYLSLSLLQGGRKGSSGLGGLITLNVSLPEQLQICTSSVTSFSADRDDLRRTGRPDERTWRGADLQHSRVYGELQKDPACYTYL